MKWAIFAKYATGLPLLVTPLHRIQYSLPNDHSFADKDVIRFCLMVVFHFHHTKKKCRCKLKHVCLRLFLLTCLLLEYLNQMGFSKKRPFHRYKSQRIQRLYLIWPSLLPWTTHSHSYTRAYISRERRCYKCYQWH